MPPVFLHNPLLQHQGFGALGLATNGSNSAVALPLLLLGGRPREGRNDQLASDNAAAGDDQVRSGQAATDEASTNVVPIHHRTDPKIAALGHKESKESDFLAFA